MTTALSADQMREVDRIMVEDLGVSILQMMENAGRSLAALAIEQWAPARATVLVGSGGNGGGGMAAARHLTNHGVDVHVTPSRSLDAMDGAPAAQMRSLKAMDVRVEAAPASADLVIDALIGYSLVGDPRGREAELIEWANNHGTVLSLDLPSGLDATSGRIAAPCIHATATLTLALPKQGLFESPEVVGDLYLGDISIPRKVYARLGLYPVDPFGGKWVVPLTDTG